MSRVFAARLALAYLGLYSAVLSVALVTLALRIYAVDPGHREDGLSLAAALGALVALFANPLAGRLSDRTTSRWGRRRPWMVAGVLGGAAGLAVMATLSSMAAIVGGWCFAQLCFNGCIAALAATVPEHVPPADRGLVSGAIGFSQRAAVPLGIGSAALFHAGPAGFLVPAAAAVFCVLLLALPLRDDPVPRSRERDRKRRRTTAADILRGFWVDPRSHPDFAWMWVTRFFTYFAAVAPAPYLAYYLIERVGVSSSTVAATVTLLTTVNYLLSAGTAAVCGWLSDRSGRRKPFVASAAVLLATGLGLLAATPTLPAIYLAQALLGIGSGLYFGVDMALATEVLPDSEQVGKDLGVVNSADVMPQVIGPALAPLLLAVRPGHNYTALYSFNMAIGLLGALAVTRIRTVR